jgi:hypothetical protein
LNQAQDQKGVVFNSVTIVVAHTAVDNTGPYDAEIEEEEEEEDKRKRRRRRRRGGGGECAQVHYAQTVA